MCSKISNTFLFLFTNKMLATRAGIQEIACQNSKQERLLHNKSGPEVIKLFPCSTQLSMKFQLLIKTKLPTNDEVYCLRPLRFCIYHANKC